MSPPLNVYALSDAPPPVEVRGAQGEAVRALPDMTVSGDVPYASHFHPEGEFQGDSLSKFFPGGHATAAMLSGTWTLSITDERNDGTTPPSQSRKR